MLWELKVLMMCLSVCCGDEDYVMLANVVSWTVVQTVYPRKLLFWHLVQLIKVAASRFRSNLGRTRLKHGLVLRNLVEYHHIRQSSHMCSTLRNCSNESSSDTSADVKLHDYKFLNMPLNPNIRQDLHLVLKQWRSRSYDHYFLL